MGNIPYQEPKFFANHKSFLKGRKHVEDEPRSRRPSTSKTEETCEGSCEIRPSFNNKDDEWPVKLKQFYRTSNFDRRFAHAKGLCQNGAEKPSPSRNFWPQKAFLWFPSPPIHLISVLVTFSFPKIKKCLKRTSFWDCGEHPKECDRHAKGHTGWSLPALLPRLGTTTPPMYSCRRELLWRG